MIFPAREVSMWIKKLVSRSRALYPHLYLNRHDYEDMAQEILIHVASKWDQQRGDKWHRWVNTITRNQIVNKLRDRIVAHRRMPVTVMISSIVQDDEWGEEEIVYVPDIPAPEDGIDKTRAAIDELSPSESGLLYAYVKHGCWRGVGEEIGMTSEGANRRGKKAAALVRAML